MMNDPPSPFQHQTLLFLRTGEEKDGRGMKGDDRVLIAVF
jgi:hypothetical protein